jgi:hypothetical protein
MTRYHLHARYFVGPMKAPQRDETRKAESDDLCALRAQAAHLTAAGFTVWLFEYGPNPARALYSHGLHLVETLRPAQLPPAR